MKKWLIVHSLESFSQNPRMIGFPAKTKLDGSPVLDKNGKPTPAYKRISEIKSGDRIVYYCKADAVIKGIYEIVQPCYAKEAQWPDSPFQFEIKPIVELEDPYNFKLLLSSLDLFKHLSDIRNWGMSLQGTYNSIKPLTDHDFKLIKKSTTQTERPFPKYSFKYAAYKVLSLESKPLNTQEITEKALKKGFLKTSGKTPQQSMGAQLYTDLKKKSSPFMLLGKNRFGLKKWGIEVLEKEIKKAAKEDVIETKKMRKRSIVGDPISFRGLIYGPLNENGVIYLFALVAKDLGIIIEQVQPTFPDARGRRRTKRGWEEVWIEFEYQSSAFKTHGHDPKKCDIIVCWEDDWPGCPLEVIELKSVIRINN